ncbi:MAG: protein-glutamate O-methyltransferase CheR [Alphaproteobacteria bacterium]|nr:protein-glutamate O-methyltransferase CheR [Alphaproteobacteria bacterium]
MSSQLARHWPAAAPAPRPSAAMPAPAQLRETTFRRLVLLVRQTCGISLAPSKRLMLQTRLGRRLRATGLEDFDAYTAMLTGPNPSAAEMQAFIDCVVTNETSFFREPPHFEYLTSERLQTLSAGGSGGQLAMWSAACSTGEEVWTLAMVAAAAQAAAGASGGNWSALATDISITALTRARRGIYPAEAIGRLPQTLASRYLLREGGGETLSVAPELRRNVRFGQINLMDSRYLPGRMMDIIFCRNVLIYFDAATQAAIVRKLCAHLRPGGLLFLGHSDMSREGQAPLRLLRNNIHERLED